MLNWMWGFSLPIYSPVQSLVLGFIRGLSCDTWMLVDALCRPIAALWAHIQWYSKGVRFNKTCVWKRFIDGGLGHVIAFEVHEEYNNEDLEWRCYHMKHTTSWIKRYQPCRASSSGRRTNKRSEGGPKVGEGSPRPLTLRHVIGYRYPGTSPLSTLC